MEALLQTIAFSATAGFALAAAIAIGLSAWMVLVLALRAAGGERPA